MQQLNKLADNLATVGNAIHDDDLIYHILNGLHADYDLFATSIQVCDLLVSPDELHSLIE